RHISSPSYSGSCLETECAFATDSLHLGPYYKPPVQTSSDLEKEYDHSDSAFDHNTWHHPECFEPDQYGYSRPWLWLYCWSASSNHAHPSEKLNSVSDKIPDNQWPPVNANPDHTAALSV